MASMPAVRSQAPASARGASGQSEGIGIHGHWTIEVRNPDGTPVSRHEFRNALQNDGKITLVRLLQGASMIGALYVSLDNPVLQSLPCLTSDLPSFASSCIIAPASDSVFTAPPYGAQNVFRNLLVSHQTQPAGAVVLTGSATASRNGVISQVSTQATRECGFATVAPLSVPCDQSALPQVLTALALAPSQTNPNLQPIAVATGQVIQVTVRLTFS
jgi:hypothetical protein